MNQPVRNFMTKTPHSANVDVDVSTALKIMNQNNIRHLPVLEGGVIVGILSDRDLELVGLTSAGSQLKVRDLMNFDPYIVEPDLDIQVVAMGMLERKISSAIVKGTEDEPWGIFTVTDALMILAGLRK
ncbi:MAG: CBS domain-containing protein [Bdellovibrionales bacterium]|nr:CBS domain-containing protein [Bdellovibrionales bacterium]